MNAHVGIVHPIDVSVLMSTYPGETAQNLNDCLKSISDQTVHPGQVVLVVDGPIDAGQEAVIERFSNAGMPITLVRRPASGGLAAAMNDGIGACRCPLTMRMDSDDLCLPDRVEVQTAYLCSHPHIDIVSSWGEEFFVDGAAKMKVSPCEHDDIIKALRWRNVIVHPSVMIRTFALRDIGGYRTKFGMLEDYDLFIRLALNGFKFHVIPKVLVRVRASPAQNERRGGLTYLRREVAFRLECRRKGFLSLREFVFVTGFYSVFRLISGPMRRRLYKFARI